MSSDDEIILFMFLIISFLAGIGFYFGYLTWHPDYNDYVTREEYNKLSQDYQELEKENRELKINQEKLLEQMAKYLVEQTTIDLIGIKKFGLIYGLLKIPICNEKPELIIC